MIAGAPGDVATNAETMLARRALAAERFRCRAARSATTCSMPRSSAARRRTASSSTTATASARRIAAAPSCRPRSASATSAAISGAQLIEAVVAGYEVAICLARACAPDLRQRGFHPTSAVGPFGAAVAVAKLRGLYGAADRRRARHRGERRRRPVRLRQRRRRHQAPARRPRLARRHPGRAAGRAWRAGPAQRDRGARRLHAGLRVRPFRQGARRSRCRRTRRSASPTATSSPMRAAATSSPPSRRCSA